MSGDIFAPKPHAFEKRPVNDAGRGKSEVFTLCHILDAKNPCMIGNTARTYERDITLVLQHELAKHVAAQAFQRHRREHALRAPPNTHQHINRRIRQTGGNRACHITVRNKRHARASIPYLFDHFNMPRPVKDYHRHFFYCFMETLGNRAYILTNRHIQFHRALCLRPYRELLHVHIRRLKERALRAGCYHRNRIRAAMCHTVGRF